MGNLGLTALYASLAQPWFGHTKSDFIILPKHMDSSSSFY